MKLVFIADYYVDDILGGGEICNDVVITKLSDTFDILKIKSNKCSISFLEENKNNFFIIANFLNISQDCLRYITNNCKYIIYEHDYKFCIDRNPANYLNFQIPKNKLVFESFFKNAKKIICQSTFQKNIIEKNLSFNNTISIGTNFWHQSEYELMRDLSNLPKEDKISIINYNIDHKNTNGAVKYCKDNNKNYVLIYDNDRKLFLEKLSSNRYFIFLPKTPETFSRTVLESRMMNVEVITNQLIGCKHEEWYNLYKGSDLIDFTIVRNTEAISTFKDIISS